MGKNCLVFRALGRVKDADFEWGQRIIASSAFHENSLFFRKMLFFQCIRVFF